MDTDSEGFCLLSVFHLCPSVAKASFSAFAENCNALWLAILALPSISLKVYGVRRRS